MTLIALALLSLSAGLAAGPENTNSPSIGGELLDLKNKPGLEGFGQNGVRTSREGESLRVVFQKGQAYPNIAFPIPQGGWNLSAFGGVQVQVSNPGTSPVRAFLRVDNPGRHQDSPWNTHSVQVEPGKTSTLGGLFGTDGGNAGFPLDPKAVSGIQVFLINPDRDVELVLTGLKAYGSPGDRADSSSLSAPGDRQIPVTPPTWLGKRPPVEGAWRQTLDENFDGSSLDLKRWTTRFPWNGPMPGQLQRYAPENVIVEGGLARFKVEKKKGHENNDPQLGERDYSSGLIQSYDKWTQLYGYFEARIRVPKARGLWPAFWMMPDRGPDSKDKSGRRDTDGQGMEIDIMEILAEWGAGRNNVAVHWDGYGADHKAWGTNHVYFGPTPDAWHAFGLLWEPGRLAWYIDGILKAEWKNPRVGSVPAYLKLNVQMGGWATTNVDETALPDFMDVDYVRAWQLRRP